VSGSVVILSEGGEIARRTRYKVGEGIIGRVVESGKPMVVPQVSQEPLFLDRTGVVRKSRSEMTFICVPVVVNDRTAGALGVTLPYRHDRSTTRS
jgi:Nif-specific regulatory protein